MRRNKSRSQRGGGRRGARAQTQTDEHKEKQKTHARAQAQIDEHKEHQKTNATARTQIDESDEHKEQKEHTANIPIKGKRNKGPHPSCDSECPGQVKGWASTGLHHRPNPPCLQVHGTIASSQTTSCPKVVLRTRR